MSEPTKAYSVPESLMDKIIGYLGTRPYQEVFVTMNEICALIESQNSQPPKQAVEPDVINCNL